MPTWDDFTEWAIRQSEAESGRKALRRRWARLRALADQVAGRLDPEEIRRLLGKTFDQLDPEHNDLKALVAYGVGKGLLDDPTKLQSALQSDIRADPLHFLAQHSGKTFGEKFAPLFARFWLVAAGDSWEKQPPKGLFDVAWTPTEIRQPIRIELKASSEQPNYLFQQIRHPLLSGSNERDYDLLLCLGVSAGSLEWWAIPATQLDSVAENGTTRTQDVVITRHHGKRRDIWNAARGYSDEGWFRTDLRGRNLLSDYLCGSSDLLRDKILSYFL